MLLLRRKRALHPPLLANIHQLPLSNFTPPVIPQKQESSHNPATYRQLLQPVPPLRRADSDVVDSNSTGHTAEKDQSHLYLPSGLAAVFTAQQKKYQENAW